MRARRTIETVGLCVLLTSAVAVAAPPADDAWVAAVEGGWSGDADHTPMGAMPFVMLFDRTADGSLHCRSALNRDTYIDLRFWKADDGRWMLDEAAGLEGQGEQAYTLAPVESDGAVRRWVVAEKPGYMTIDVLVDEGRMAFDVEVHGVPHASFDLARMPDEQLPAMRAALERQGDQSPEEMSIHDVVAARGPQPAADPIDEARQWAAAHPDDAEAQLELARQLSEAIQADAANGPRFAFEMLQALETAVRLDPALSDAYAYLVGYYLNAPAIAGGSVDKAEQTAHNLAAFDPATSEALLGQVTRHRAAAR